MPTPLVAPPVRAHFAFADELDLNIRESFVGFGDTVLAGAQWSSWQRDNAVWDFRRGIYRKGSAGFIRTVPAKLRVNGATLESHGIDPLARISSGTLIALCDTLYPEKVKDAFIEFRLYSCANESAQTILCDAAVGMASFMVSNGSYVLWARCILGDLSDNNEINAGEWSGLKVRVGSGSFAVAPNISPNPGCPLYSKDAAAPEIAIAAENEADSRVCFDPLARTVSASGVTHRNVLLVDSSVDVPAGSQLIGGIRASTSGPQTALWVLNPDLSVRLLAVSTVFSNGFCECAKADHNASDIAQAPDGTIYLLNECSLHRYAPDKATVGERLPGSPQQTGGEPGGQCLQFHEGKIVFSTELLEVPPSDLGFYYYNRQVIRLAGRDIIGPGTIYHGPNYAEIYKGKMWAFRGTEEVLNSPTGQVVFDYIENGTWSGGGVPFPAKPNFWRQLKRRGNLLFFFGYDGSAATDGSLDTPICAIADGRTIRRALFSYFVKRVTRSEGVTGAETLTVVCNDLTTGHARRNDGRSLRVVELAPDGTGGHGGTEFCFFYNEPNDEYRQTRSAFLAAGGDIAQLPAFYRWVPQQARNGGGVWVATATLPLTGYYLELDLSGDTLIRYRAGSYGPPVDILTFGGDTLTFGGDALVIGVG